MSKFIYLTFHFFFQGETAVDSLQLRLHCETTDIRLQVGSIYHADAKDYEGHVLGLRGHQAAFPLRVSAIILLVLKHNSTSRFSWASNTYENTNI